MDHTGDRGREAGADLNMPGSTEVHSHLGAGSQTAGASAENDTSGRAERTVNRVREGTEEIVDRVKDAGHEVKDRVHDMREKLDDGWSQARSRVRGVMDDAEEVLEERTGILPWTRSNPLPAAMIAFGVGLVLSGGAMGGKRTGVRGQLRSVLLSSLGGALVSEVRGFLDGTLRS
jgi:ElaB/YqjD/DUF883 family membrane-anchored ribosome-binding protein